MEHSLKIFYVKDFNDINGNLKKHKNIQCEFSYCPVVK